MSRLAEHVHGRGHPNVRAVHPSTIGVTGDPEIGVEGDCFIMVSADKAASTLSEGLKTLLRAV